MNARHKRRVRHSATASLVALLTCGSCAAHPAGSTAAPPVVVCGTTLSRSAAGPVIPQASVGTVTIRTASVGGLIFLRLNSGCERGANYTIEPESAASLTATATAHDHKAAAVVLAPHAAHFDVRITHADRTVSTALIRLDSNSP